MKSFLTVCILVFLVTGCFAPSPHTSERLHEFQGHIVDASTGQPISGAKVALHEHPHVHTITDKNGYFHFSKENNWHVGYFALLVSEDVPRAKYWAAFVDITHRGYIPRQIDAASPTLQLGLTNNQQQLEFWELVNGMADMEGKTIPPFVLVDIALTPSNKPPNTASEPTAK